MTPGRVGGSASREAPSWVVTGAGCVTPAGRGVAALYDAWISGESMVRPVRRFDASALAVRIAGEMPDPHEPWSAGLRGAAHLVDCADQAWAAAGLPRGVRVAVVVATTKGFLDSGRRTVPGDPSHDVGFPARWLADHLRARFGACVPPEHDAFAPLTVSTACASGTSALALVAARARAYAHGRFDAVVVAGVDLLSDFVFRGFAALAAMDPAPCRPFDSSRAGMSASEAAAVLVLEPECSATARGATVVGRLAGWGLANDASHPTAPDRDGAGLAAAASDAIRRAAASPADLGHVHAHGTATIRNDAMEVRALTLALGASAAGVPVSTVKGTIGHAFGAAGLVETIASLEAVRRGALPGVRGLRTPEPGLRFAVAPVVLRSPLFLKVSAGFGGFDAAIVLEGCPPRGTGGSCGVPA